MEPRFLFDSSKEVASDHTDPEVNLQVLLNILLSPINKRTGEEVQILTPLINNLPLIINNDIIQQSGKHHTIVEELCQVMTCKQLKAHQVVFRYGDYGNNFYVIVDGTTSVHIPMINQDDDPTSPGTQARKIFKEITRLTAPNSFGDLALID